MAIRVNARHAGRSLSCPVARRRDPRVLASPMEATALPDFRMGAVSVQDTTAQLAAPVLDVRAGHYVLDPARRPATRRRISSRSLPRPTS
jgi:16S rRNA C967 or C1407 C5-methylase (RsmB/RsmF family)